MYQNYSLLQKHSFATYDSSEEATVEILQCLTCPTHFGSVLSEENDRSHLVLEVFKVNNIILFHVIDNHVNVCSNISWYSFSLKPLLS